MKASPDFVDVCVDSGATFCLDENTESRVVIHLGVNVNLTGGLFIFAYEALSVHALVYVETVIEVDLLVGVE